jgi:hypothetical protein
VPQQVGTAARELAQLVGGLVLVVVHLPAPGVTLRLAVKLGYQNPVSLRGLIEHVF